MGFNNKNNREVRDHVLLDRSGGAMTRLVVEAALLAIVGLWSVADGYRLTLDAREASGFDALGPDRFIMVLGAVLVVLGALYLREARAQAAAAQPAAQSGESHAGASRFYLMALAFAAYIIVAPFGGYVLTTALFFLAAYWLMDVRGVVRCVMATVVTVAAFALVFVVFAGIPMPLGVVERLF